MESGWAKYRLREKYKSMWSAFNVLEWRRDKHFEDKQEKREFDADDEKEKKKPFLLGTWADWWFRLYLLVGGVHYGIDSVAKLRKYGLGIIFEECKLWYWIHHMCTVLMFHSMWQVD